MTAKLYILEESPAVRAVMMACELYEVPIEYISVNLLEGDHLKPEYLKKNPLHTVPTFEDGDLTLCDSHAIVVYLAEQYGKDDSLYPKDVKRRALVNQKLFFNAAILFQRLRNVSYPAIVEGVRKPTEKRLKDIKEAYGFLEEFLTRNKYLALDHFTIADLVAFPTTTGLTHIVPLDATKYPKVQAWISAIEKLSFAEKCNKPGDLKYLKLIRECIDV